MTGLKRVCYTRSIRFWILLIWQDLDCIYVFPIDLAHNIIFVWYKIYRKTGIAIQILGLLNKIRNSVLCMYTQSFIFWLSWAWREFDPSDSFFGRPTFRPIHFRQTSYCAKIFVQCLFVQRFSSNPFCPILTYPNLT